MTARNINDLETIGSSAFKTPGWRGVLNRLLHSRFRALAITSHRRKEGVLLSVEEYERLVEMANQHTEQNDHVLKALQREFDERLASLKEEGVSERMRSAFGEPLELKGEFRAGDSY